MPDEKAETLHVVFYKPQGQDQVAYDREDLKIDLDSSGRIYSRTFWMNQWCDVSGEAFISFNETTVKYEDQEDLGFPYKSFIFGRALLHSGASTLKEIVGASTGPEFYYLSNSDALLSDHEYNEDGLWSPIDFNVASTRSINGGAQAIVI